MMYEKTKKMATINVGLSQKKSRHGGLRTWNFQLEVLRKEYVDPGGNQRRSGTSEVIKKYSGGVSKRCSTILWNFHG